MQTKGLINQLVGEKVTKFGIGMVVNTAKKVIYFVGHFDYNMPIDRKIWDDYLSKKEKWGKPPRMDKKFLFYLTHPCISDPARSVPVNSLVKSHEKGTLFENPGKIWFFKRAQSSKPRKRIDFYYPR